jgi:hypothetical protein
MNSCIYCNKEVEPNDLVQIGKSVAHKKCFEENSGDIESIRENKEDTKVCFYCGKSFNIKKEGYRMPVLNRYAHIDCYEKNYNCKKDDSYVKIIYDYLGQELNMKFDYSACERQRLSYIKQKGYTNKGIYEALKYFYSIKGNSLEASNNRIGIVPYVYQEAHDYFSKLASESRSLMSAIENQKKKKSEKIYVKDIKEPRKKIDIDSFWG